MRTYFGLSLAAAAAGLVNISCSQIECGQGTVERDGTCVPADEATNDAECGGAGPFATVLGLDGLCETETPTECDPDTTREELDVQTGITTCVGTGGGCMSDIQCSAPDAGKVTLCGRVFDTETDDPIAATTVGTPEMECDPAAPTTDGPCSLRLRFFDALDFAMDPNGAMPIVPPGEGVFQDGCNRYRGHNMTSPTFGFIGIAVDDAPSITPVVPHRLTGVATANGSARPGRNFRAYTTRVSTDQAWSTPIFGGGMTFAQRGVLAIVFHYNDVPRSGVQVRRSGALIPGDDYYFTDTGKTRSMISMTQTSTGANGTAVVVNSATPIAHDGVGNEPSGCIWPSNLAASIQGVTFVQIKEAETAAGAACP